MSDATKLCITCSHRVVCPTKDDEDGLCKDYILDTYAAKQKMKTPTEELANEQYIEFPGRWHDYLVSLGMDSTKAAEAEKVIIARHNEAVAESDAERMKQPAVAWQHPMDIGRFNTATAKKEHDEQVGLYAQPFPSTEQLQRLFMLATGYLVEGEIDQGEYEELMAMRKALANTQGDTK